MKNMLEKLERLFAAVSFAEAGEHETARKMVDQKDRGAEVHRLGVYRDTSASHARSTRRAA